MSLKGKIAAMDIAADDRKRLTDFFDELDRVEAANKDKWAQYERIRQEFGTDTADMALVMINVRLVDKASKKTWDLAAKYAHGYLHEA